MQIWNRRSTSERLVLALLQTSQPRSRSELVEESGLSASGLSTVVKTLVADGLVVESRVPATGGRGRPASQICLSSEPVLGIGVDVGHDHVRVIVGTGPQAVLSDSTVYLDTDNSPDGTFGAIAELIDEALGNLDLKRADVRRCVVGLPAPVDPLSGRVVLNNILPRWANLAPAEALHQLIRVPVEIENDANLGALGEYTAGNAKNSAYVFYLKLSSGVGLGMLSSGVIQHGRNGAAGEIGHVQIEGFGEVCRCGARGCLETVVSLPRMLAALDSTQPRKVTTDVLTSLVMSGDPGAKRVVVDAGRTIGRTLADLCTVLSPEIIVVGGDLGKANDIVVEEIRRAIDRYTLPGTARTVQVKTSQLGAWAEAIGALVSATRLTV